MLGLGLSIPEIAIRGRRGFSPASLFANGEQGAWYDPADLSTLWQDSAGTTAVTAVEQPVGLMLDKSKGLVLGSELVTNGDFSDGSTGWVLDSGVVSGGTLNISSGAAYAQIARQSISLTAGNRYKITFLVTRTSGSFFVGLVGSYGAAISTGYSVSASGSFSLILSAQSGVNGIYFTGGVSGADLSIDNISVRELAGNHAFNPNATTVRPVLKQENGLYYLEFAGVDDWLQTASIDFTATDKMSVFAGVRKVSDAATGHVAELGTNYSNSGFAIFAPASAAANYGFGNDSVEAAFSRLATTYTAPISNVLAGFFSQTAVGGASSALTTARIDGAVPTLSTPGGTYTGNGAFANAALYIGRRGGSSAPFNGRLYSLLVLGRTATADEITSAETYVAAKTGVVLP